MPTYPPCPSCGRQPARNVILVGWFPCRCGGHRMIWYRDANGGCGETAYYRPQTDALKEPEIPTGRR